MIIKKSILFLSLLSLLNFHFGCVLWYNYRIKGDDFIKENEIKILSLILTTGEQIIFDENGGKYIFKNQDSLKYSYVFGVNRVKKMVEINTKDILEARIEKREFNVVGTIFFVTLGVPALLIGSLLVYFAIHPIRSCPFIYSFDGKDYIFEAQSFAGAITKGLKRTDYSRLNHLAPLKGKYEIMIKNDPSNEIQYVDEVKLLVADNSDSSDIVCNYEGKIFAINKTFSPVLAFDENNKNISKFFEKKDDVYWQTQMPTDSTYKNSDYRHHITLQFPKASGKKTAYLYFKAGTSHWGSEMIQKFLELRGDKIDEWYDNVDNGGEELKNLYKLIGGEELYYLKVNVFNGRSWNERGTIRSGGGTFCEDRIIPLDISDIPGDTLKIQLNIPKGFWRIDYLGINYNEPKMLEPMEVSTENTISNYGFKENRSLNKIDDNYYKMENSKSWLKLSFEVPLQKEGSFRSLFLKTTGYYKIILPDNLPDKTKLVNSFLQKPGSAVEFALDEYLKWRKQYYCDKP